MLLSAGGRNGHAAVRAMVAANVLGCRPYSEWDRDLPADAFGMFASPIITAPSAAHLFCMKMLNNDGALKEGGRNTS